MKSPILYEFILSFMVGFPNILIMLYPFFFLFSSSWQQLKHVYSFWCLLSSQLTYKSADSWPRVSTDKHTFVVGLALLPDIKQVLDPGYHNNSLWLIDPTRLHVWAPTGQLSSQFNQSFAQVRWHFSQTNTSHLWTDSFIPKNNYLYFPYWPILHSFDVYFVPELNPNTKVKIQHNS